MATDTNPAPDLEQLKQQVQILQQQLAVVNSQLALDTAKQTLGAQLAKAVAEALKNQSTAQFNLESEQAKEPFAELAGIKAATAGMQLPTGKSGTIQVSAGAASVALLRSKGEMLRLMQQVAADLDKKLPDGAVIVTDAQLDQAYQADFTASRIDRQILQLRKATENAGPQRVEMQTKALPAVIAAAYSAGLVLDTVNSLAKLFRVDRKVDVFSSDAEAGEMLAYLLEARNHKFVANPATMRKAATTEAETLLAKLTNLLNAIQAGTEVQNALDAQAKQTDAATELATQLAGAQALFDGLDPSKKSDAFWAQVKGQLIASTLQGRDRLIFEAKGQALQITESRWYASDRLMIGGEIQVAYRVFDQDGALKDAGVILKASKATPTSLTEMGALNFSSGTQ